MAERIGKVKVFVQKNALKIEERADGAGNDRLLDEPAAHQFAKKWSKEANDATNWFAMEESLTVSGYPNTSDKLYVWLSNDGKIAAAGNALSVSPTIHMFLRISGAQKDNDATKLDEDIQSKTIKENDELNPKTN